MTHHSVQDEPNRPDDPIRPPSFWRSRAGLVFLVGLVVAGLLLGYEHRIHILGSGWLLWLPLLLCFGMHFFMHGGHGGHGSKGDRE